MADGSPQRRGGARGNQFFGEIGVAGRKTGLAVKDTGVRNEFGMEDMDGFFDSSPAKSVATNGEHLDSEPEDPTSPLVNNTTTTVSRTEQTATEVSMDVASSSGLEPTEALRLRQQRQHSLPPRARSPPKLAVSGSPRRGSSIGPVSSPMKETPMRPNRVLDFSRASTSASSRANGKASSVPASSSPAQQPARAAPKMTLPAPEEEPEEEEAAPKKAPVKRTLLSKKTNGGRKTFAFGESDDEEAEAPAADETADKTVDELGPVSRDTVDKEVSQLLEDSVVQEDTAMLDADEARDDAAQQEDGTMADVTAADTTAVEPEEQEESNDEVEPQLKRGKGKAPQRKPTAKAKAAPAKKVSPAPKKAPAKKKVAPELSPEPEEEEEEAEEEEEEVEPTPKPKKTVKSAKQTAKPKGKAPPPLEPEEEEEEAEEEEPEERTPKQKATKAAARGKKTAEPAPSQKEPKMKSTRGKKAAEPVEESAKRKTTEATTKNTKQPARGKPRGQEVYDMPSDEEEEMHTAPEDEGEEYDEAPEEQPEEEEEEPEQPPRKKQARGKAAKAAEALSSDPPSSARQQTIKNRSTSVRAPRKESPAKPAEKPTRKPRGKAAPAPAASPSPESESEAPAPTRAEKAAATRAAKAAAKTSAKDKAAAKEKPVPKEKLEPKKPKAATRQTAKSSSSAEAEPARGDRATSVEVRVGKQRIIREKPPTRSPSAVADDGLRRSRRAHIPPLAYWKNEKIVYALSKPEETKKSISMPTITEIVRVEESPERPPPKRRSASKKSSQEEPAVAGTKRGRNGKPKLHKLRDEEREDAEEDPGNPDAWESNTVISGAAGVMSGLVKPYPPPPPPENSDDEEEEPELVEMELAFSRDRIVGVEVANKDFTFVKTHTSETGGTGCITIPPGGGKRPKNSGAMFLVFFVHAGRATVVVNGNKFRVGKGGQFMVPRGNLYSIDNEFDSYLKLFFTQNLYIPPAEE